MGIKSPVKDVGLQLYSVRKEMLADAAGTLKQIAKIGYKELESAKSEKGNYYGLKPKEIKKIANDLGMIVRSGHVHIDAHDLQPFGKLYPRMADFKNRFNLFIFLKHNPTLLLKLLKSDLNRLFSAILLKRFIY